MLERRAFAPLRSHTLRGNIVELLTEAILEGKIKPGQRLNETQLARELRVSRAPIRANRASNSCLSISSSFRSLLRCLLLLAYRQRRIQDLDQQLQPRGGIRLREAGI